MAPTNKPVESDDDRKARLIKEARARGVTINVRDDADTIQAALDAAPPAEAPKETASQGVAEVMEALEAEEEDDAGGKDAPAPFITPEEVEALHLKLDAATALAERRGEELKAARTKLFEMEAERDKLKVKVFDLQALVPKSALAKPKTADDDVEEFDVEAKKPKNNNEEPFVMVRITKKGHGEVDDGDGSKYSRNDTPKFPLSVARALEARGYAEIED